MKEKIKLNLNTIQTMCFDISDKGEFDADYYYYSGKIKVVVYSKKECYADYLNILELDCELPIEKLQNLIKDLKKYL